MILLTLLEFVVAALFLYFVSTQLLIPLWRDTPLFPWLERERGLRYRRKEAKQEVVETRIKRDIFKVKGKNKKIKSSMKG